MESDHLGDAIKFLREMLRQDAEYGRMSRYNAERALDHVLAEQRNHRANGQSVEPEVK